RRWKTWAAGRCPSPGDRAFAGFSTGAPGEVLHELAESSQLVAHALHRAGGRGLFEVEGHLQVLEIQVKIIENVAQVVSDFVSEGEHGGRACTITGRLHFLIGHPGSSPFPCANGSSSSPGGEGELPGTPAGTTSQRSRCGGARPRQRQAVRPVCRSQVSYYPDRPPPNKIRPGKAGPLPRLWVYNYGESAGGGAGPRGSGERGRAPGAKPRSRRHGDPEPCPDRSETGEGG